MATLSEYRDREHWSFSALNQFLNICSLQFAFDRVYKLKREFTPLNLSFGSAFHRAMEWLHLTAMADTPPPVAEARDRFQDFWSRQLAEDRDIRFDAKHTQNSCSAQGADMVEAVANAIDSDERVVAVNRAFAVPLTDADGNALEKPMIGEIDLVVVEAGCVNETMVDWKTSARRWSKDQAHKSMQATTYCYAHKTNTGRDAPMRFDVAVKAAKPVVERHRTTRTEDDFLRMAVLVRKVEAMVKAEHFLPNETGFYCASCPHAGACKSWHREMARTHVRMAA